MGDFVEERGVYSGVSYIILKIFSIHIKIFQYDLVGINLISIHS